VTLLYGRCTVTSPLLVRLFEIMATGQYSIKKAITRLYDEGIGHSKPGRKLTPSSAHRILTNPIYYGQFRWDGVLYAGVHPTLVDRATFDAVQQALGRPSKERVSRQSLPYMNLATCGHCGCTITAERKVKKSGREYVYYHCTGHRGKCDEPYMPQEKFAEELPRYVGAIRIDDGASARIADALRSTQAEEKRYQAEVVAGLNRELGKVRSRMAQAYEDRLDGKISAGTWESLNQGYRSTESELARKLDAQHAGRRSYIETGIQILELAQKAPNLYQMQDHNERTKLLLILLSNCTIKDGKVSATYRKPFDLFAEGTDLQNWRPQRDSNPRRRRERAVS
jgi:site-specific DNA recombinase